MTQDEVVQIVLENAYASADYLVLLKKLGDVFGPLRQICRTKGCSRRVFLLPEGLVLKVCYAGEKGLTNNQNVIEKEMSSQFPDDTPKVLASYISDDWIGRTPPRGINILVSEYADMPEDIIYDVRLHSPENRARRGYFQQMFADTHDDEVGFINGRMVVVDLGRDCKKHRENK